MKQKKMLSLTLSQLKNLYQQDFPELVEIATQSLSANEFKDRLSNLLTEQKTASSAISEQIRILIDFDGKCIHELSTGQDIEIQTIGLLWHFLKDSLEQTDKRTDLFIDLYEMLSAWKQVKKRENLFSREELEKALKKHFFLDC